VLFVVFVAGTAIAAEYSSSAVMGDDEIEAWTPSSGVVGPIDISKNDLVAAVTPWSGIGVVGCTNETLEVQGWRAPRLEPGKILIYYQDDGAAVMCESCSPLFRRIVAVESSGASSFFRRRVRTEFVALDDIVTQDTRAPKTTTGPQRALLLGRSIEPQFGCAHSGGARRRRTTMVAASSDGPPFPQNCDRDNVAGSDWFRADPATGRCDYSDCCLGPNPPDTRRCLYCETDERSCFNGCGTDFLTFDGNLKAFDFGRACCNHDLCYYTPFYDKSRCDDDF